MTFRVFSVGPKTVVTLISGIRDFCEGKCKNKIEKERVLSKFDRWFFS